MEVSKTLCVRVDRIGDLVLTMSADFELRARGDDVVWLIARGLSFIPQQSQPPRAFYQVDMSFSLIRLIELMRWLKKQAFENVIIFHAPFWVYLAVWLVGIPVRTGRKSQWYSFLMLNKGIRQSRKSGDRSELFYNSQLVQKSLLAGAKGTEKNHFLRLRPFLNKSELAPLGISIPYVVIHPGMSGSARNWTVQHYIDLAKSLSEDYQVVITGTAADRQYWKPVHQALGGQSLCLAENLSAQDLVGVLAYASLVVAPSTGVVHLAAAAGAPTLGLYSPVKNQSSSRWGPKGEKVLTLTPEVDCPGQTECLMSDCPNFDCMGTYKTERLIGSAKQMLAQGDTLGT